MFRATAIVGEQQVNWECVYGVLRVLDIVVSTVDSSIMTMTQLNDYSRLLYGANTKFTVQPRSFAMDRVPHLAGLQLHGNITILVEARLISYRFLFSNFSVYYYSHQYISNIC